MRLRTTELPTFLVTVKPKRGASAFSEASARNLALAPLQHETALVLAAPLGGGKEVGALFKARDRWPHALSRESGSEFRRRRDGSWPGAPDDAGASASGRKALAATRATGGDDLAAADGGHARAKTVATLAHELGGLIGPLHGYAPVCLGASTGRPDARAYYKGFTLRRFFIANDEKRRRREAEIASGLIKAWPRKSQREAGRNPGMEFGVEFGSETRARLCRWQRARRKKPARAILL